MSVRSASAGILFCALLLAPAAALAAANVGIEFLAEPERNNDTQIYLHVAYSALKSDGKQETPLWRSIHNPESNLPVVLFMAREAKVSPARVWEMRSSGMTWVEVMSKLDIPQKSLFLQLDRDPGPPYGKAYGHWKNRRSKSLKITDADVYFWVNVHAISRYFGVSATTVVDWRTSGKTWKVVAADEYRKSHPAVQAGTIDAAGMGFDSRPGTPPAHSKGRGKDHRR